jgi:hypothetical protein
LWLLGWLADVEAQFNASWKDGATALKIEDLV